MTRIKVLISIILSFFSIKDKTNLSNWRDMGILVKNI
jgi:hypothetical protein